MLGTVLEVDQNGPYTHGEVNRHQVSLLIDTGATRSTVHAAVISNLPLKSMLLALAINKA
mgnify:CR=1 FL=1